MAYNGTNYGDITTRVGIQTIAKSLAQSEQQLVLMPFGRHEKLSMHKGLTVKWRRPVLFNVSTTSLTEGVTPAPQAYSQEVVTGTLYQYGSWCPVTDVVTDMHEDPIMRDIQELMTRNQTDVKEMLVWETILGGTQNVIYTNGSARTDVNTVITKDDIAYAVRILKTNYAPKLTKRLAPSTSVATEPVNASYIYFGNTYLENTFRGMDGFVPVERYGSFQPVNEYEIGKVDECRIVLTNYARGFADAGGSASGTGVVSTTGTSADVFPGIVLAEEAFATATVGGLDGMKLTVKNPGDPTKDDPLGQRGFASWKWWFLVKILNEDRMVRIESAAPTL